MKIKSIIILSTISFFSYAGLTFASMQNLNLDNPTSDQNGSATFLQTFSGAEGTLGNISFLNDLTSASSTNINWLTIPSSSITAGQFQILDVTDGIGNQFRTQQATSMTYNAFTGEIKFTLTSSTFEYISNHIYAISLAISDDGGSKWPHLRGTIGNTFANGELFAGVGTSLTGCTYWPPNGSGDNFYECDDVGNRNVMRDLYFKTDSASALVWDDITDSYYTPTSTADFADLTSQTCDYLDVGCALTKGLANVVGILFKPSELSLNWISASFEKAKTVFPFSIFFSTIDSVQNAVTNFDDSESTLNLEYTFPNGNLSNSTGSITILNINTCSDRFGTTWCNWWYNIILMLSSVLLAWGMFKVIYHPH